MASLNCWNWANPRSSPGVAVYWSYYHMVVMWCQCLSYLSEQAAVEKKKNCWIRAEQKSNPASVNLPHRAVTNTPVQSFKRKGTNLIISVIKFSLINYICAHSQPQINSEGGGEHILGQLSVRPCYSGSPSFLPPASFHHPLISLSCPP